MSIRSMSSINKPHLSNIHILPCLQELKQLKQARLFEPEQQEGIFDEITNKIKYKYGRFNDTSDQYDKIWSGRTSHPRETIYLIPSFKKYGFSGECKKYEMLKKWIMFFDYFYDTFAGMNKTEISVIMVTHHNRLKSKNSYQGLFPMNSEYCNAYANTFCLKIYKDDSTDLNCKIVYSGVPDKGTFRDNCIVHNPINTTTMSNRSLGSNRTLESKRSLGSKRTLKSKRRFTPNLSKIAEEEEYELQEQEGGTENEYHYCCSTNTENENDNHIFSNSLDIVRSAFRQSNFFNNGNLKTKLNIYIIRHGNAIHNKPIDADRRVAGPSVLNKYERIDSSLSDEGIKQAEILGRILKAKENINTRSLLVCTSFLSRTKHTALLLMDQLYGSSLDVKLEEEKEKLNKISRIREEPLRKKVDEPKKVDRSLLQTSQSIRPSSRSRISSYSRSGSGFKKQNRTKRPKRMRKKI